MAFSNVATFTGGLSSMESTPTAAPRRRVRHRVERRVKGIRKYETKRIVLE